MESVSLQSGHRVLPALLVDQAIDRTAGTGKRSPEGSLFKHYRLYSDDVRIVPDQDGFKAVMEQLGSVSQFAPPQSEAKNLRRW